MPMPAEPVFFENAAAFRAWLARHATGASELLVGFYKVGSGHASMRWSESVDQALCYGWIDGVRRSLGDHGYAIRFTPRKATSIWSAVNIARIEALYAQGLMTPAGEQAFARRSEERSRVYAHERETPAELTPDEVARFQADAAAWTYFAACPPGYRERVLHWLDGARKAQTRGARLERLVDACALGRRLTIG